MLNVIVFIQDTDIKGYNTGSCITGHSIYIITGVFEYKNKGERLRMNSLPIAGFVL